MTGSYQNKNLVAVVKSLFIVTLLLVPFQGIVTTWIGSNFGNLLLWRGWKEALLLVSVGSVSWLFWRDTKLRRTLTGRKLNLIILIFSLWLLFVTLLGSHDSKSALLGLVIQLRLFVIFIVAQTLAFYKALTKRQLVTYVLLSGAVVVIFGLLQMFVLPYDFLKHFGYVKGSTIQPFFTIDDQLGKFRIASTLRGPNPLGVYLILPALLATSSIWQNAKSKKQSLQTFLLIAFCILLSVVLYGSHSRGAWIGFLAAIGVWALLSLPRKWRAGLVCLGAVAVLVGGLGVYSYRHTSFVEDVVLHDNPVEGGEVSSNVGHLDALKAGLKDIKNQPVLGCGAGCAGPASAHNPAGTKIAENYYLQTAQESGIIGLGLLLAIFTLVTWLLYQNSDDPLRRALLAVFAGISVASLLTHAWADDTIAYLWWGLAGYVVYNGTNNLHQAYDGQEGKQSNGKKKKDNLDSAR